MPRFNESKFRLKTGGFKFKGRVVGGMALDPQAKAGVKSGKFAIKKSRTSSSGFAITKGPNYGKSKRKSSAMRMPKL